MVFHRDMGESFVNPEPIEVFVESLENKLIETVKILTPDGKIRYIYVPMTLAAAENYSAEDVMCVNATVGVPYIFTSMGRSGTIEKAIIFCSVTALEFRPTLYLFSGYPTGELRDNVGNTSPVAANAHLFVGQIDFLLTKDMGGGSSQTATCGTYGGLPLPYVTSEGEILYGIAVTADAITGEAAGMTLAFGLQTRLD